MSYRNSTRALFDVTQSLSGMAWISAEADPAAAARMAQLHGLPEIVSRILLSRGITLDSVPGFLQPSLARDFPNPWTLQDMDKAAPLIAEAVEKNRKIGIFSDFDVDGATSAALWVRFFRALGLEVPVYIPDRLKEGYGPTVQGLESLRQKGCELILICDCGITAFDVLKEANARLGGEYIVLDHHQAEPEMPPAASVINPKRQDDTSGLDVLAAVGVCFLTAVAVNGRLRDAGFYERSQIAPPDLRVLMDLVALGTVCDMVPLIGPNRLFVRHGMRQIARMENPGLQALARIANFEGEPHPQTLGFVFGPRINAGGRVNNSALGARILSTDSAEEAAALALKLDDCNRERRRIEQDMTRGALTLALTVDERNPSILILENPDWHPGLVGLVAGRLKEKLQKPAVICTREGEVIKGSARSVPGVHIGNALIAARHEGLLVSGGGHAMAGGLTCRPENFEALCDFLKSYVDEALEGATPVQETVIDAPLSIRGVTLDLARLIQEDLAPFGQEFPEPLFALPECRIFRAEPVNGGHVRAVLGDSSGGSGVKAMAFRAQNTALGEALLKAGQGASDSMPLHVVARVALNHWQGQSRAELHIHDAALMQTQERRRHVESEKMAASGLD